ncbi:MAG: hypothetical protein ACJAVI_000179 [Candidatus Azotimanducaceae bacterium]|jgi:hypothetical protein
MTDKIFQVVFNGAITGEYDMQTTKARFKKVFKLTTTQLEKLFAGSDVVIKKNVDEDIAIQLAIKIANVGCESYIEHMPTEDPNIADENRKADERRVRFRRPPRAGAIVQDRRVNIRRGTDIEYVEDLLQKESELPIEFRAYPRKN